VAVAVAVASGAEEEAAACFSPSPKPFLKPPDSCCARCSRAAASRHRHTQQGHTAPGAFPQPRAPTRHEAPARPATEAPRRGSRSHDDHYLHHGTDKDASPIDLHSRGQHCAPPLRRGTSPQPPPPPGPATTPTPSQDQDPTTVPPSPLTSRPSAGRLDRHTVLAPTSPYSGQAIAESPMRLGYPPPPDLGVQRQARSAPPRTKRRPPRSAPSQSAGTSFRSCRELSVCSH
jgi:hypothetical protein